MRAAVITIVSYDFYVRWILQIIGVYKQLFISCRQNTTFPLLAISVGLLAKIFDQTKLIRIFPRRQRQCLHKLFVVANFFRSPLLLYYCKRLQFQFPTRFFFHVKIHFCNESKYFRFEYRRACSKQKYPQEMLYKKRPETLSFISKRLRRRFLPVNFAKFLRISFLQNISRRLFSTSPTQISLCVPCN